MIRTGSLRAQSVSTNDMPSSQRIATAALKAASTSSRFTEISFESPMRYPMPLPILPGLSRVSVPPAA